MALPDAITTPVGDVTVVLVHGAFADAASWNGALPALQQRGLTRART
jgi:hypothetical protein